MNRIIFGSAFDPPHNGHLSLLQTLEQALPDARIHFLPAAQNPQKPPCLFSRLHRFRMASLLSTLTYHTEVSDLELVRGGHSFTVETLSHFRSRYPQDEWFVAMGADCFLSFLTWRDYEMILMQAQILVVNRGVESLAQCKAYLAEHFPSFASRIHFVEMLDSPLSSTSIRRLLAVGESIQDQVPSFVFDYLNKHAFLGPKPRVKVLGITGRSGVGKTWAQKILMKHFGLTLMDLDVVGHQIINEPEIVKSIREKFGDDVLDEDQNVLRPKLGEKVFSDPQLLRELSRIMHPRMKQFVQEAVYASTKPVLLTGSLIDEIGLSGLCNEIWVIEAEDADIVKFSGEKKLKISWLQKPRDQFLWESHIVIQNHFDVHFEEEILERAKLWYS